MSPKALLVLACFAAAPAAAQAPRRAAAPPGKVDVAAAHLERMKAAVRQVQADVDTAREEKDLVKLECASDRLTRVKALLRVGEQADVALHEAVSKDDPAAEAELAKIGVARVRVEALRAESERCIGQLAYVAGDRTVVEVSQPQPRPAIPALAARPAAGDAGLHPTLEVEDRYDSSVYYTGAGQRVGDMILHVRPGLELAVPGEVAAAELAAALDWAQYLGVGSGDVKGAAWKLYGHGSASLGLNRRRVVGLELSDDFRRAPGTTALLLGGGAVSTSNLLAARVPFRPGGGALVFTGKASWLREAFERLFGTAICDPAVTSGCLAETGKLGWDRLRAGGEVRWSFLPRTAAVLEAGWFSHAAADRRVSGADVLGGVTGLVTPQLAATVEAGYASTAGIAGGDLRSWLARLEAEWTAGDGASARLGFTRSLGMDVAAAPFTANRVHGGVRLAFGGRFALRAGASFESRDYDRLSSDAPRTSASASVLRLEPAIEASLARWLSASAGYAFGKRSSSFAAAAPILPGYDEARHETWFRLAARY